MSCVKSHFLVVTTPYFGHTRPLFMTALNLVVTHPGLYITVAGTGATSPLYQSPLHRELAMYDPGPDALSRIRIKLLGEGEEYDHNFWQTASLFKHLPAFLESLISGDDGSKDSDVFTWTPSLAICDLAACTMREALDEVISKSSRPSLKIPVLVSMPMNAATQYLLWAPNEEDKNGFWLTLFERAQKELDKINALGNTEDIPLPYQAYKIWTRVRNEVVKLPATPPMYDYEFHAMADALDHSPTSVGGLFPFLGFSSSKLGQVADGFISPTSPVLEPGAANILERNYGKTYLQVGPQFPTQWWEDGIPKQVQTLSPEDKTVLDYLDYCESHYGKKSVIYISFGTLFAPSERPELFETLVETLLAADPPLPFLFAGAYSRKYLTEDLKQRVNSSDRGMIAGFVPQQAALKHAATGWYLCHAGCNSVAESILNNVPMVLWPYTLDQPIIAAQLTLNFEAAFELIQVRTGPNTGRPMVRGVTPSGTREAIAEEMNDIWKRMRGPEGDAIRQRVDLLRSRFKDDWLHGEAKHAMDRFSQYMIPRI
ncbi:UDP-Glycosyltransferase/glycogen phosphorylase [Fistulina hepatica ATCC 64428]|uniref:UDP-Glycosyltransferase/glycogen phosphorylase n=1 Tax=Fistulina hepatica ATCC 64428 TaxID=1128425 RepID=A0A0D7A4P2_9AGAR|nr:UDP-Glycosyltransferase/glycogen phosphorylase [Fistulina hepatica ATCC 64428]